jgi:hypothetical protein
VFVPRALTMMFVSRAYVMSTESACVKCSPVKGTCVPYFLHAMHIGTPKLAGNVYYLAPVLHNQAQFFEVLRLHHATYIQV